MKHKNCFLRCFGSFVVNLLKNTTVVQKHIYNLEDPCDVISTASCVELHLCSALGLLLPVKRREQDQISS